MAAEKQKIFKNAFLPGLARGSIYSDLHPWHTVQWLSSEIWSVSLNGVQALQDSRKLATLEYICMP